MLHYFVLVLTQYKMSDTLKNEEKFGAVLFQVTLSTYILIYFSEYSELGQTSYS